MTDLIIIGAGPAGVSAALYVKRAGFSVTAIHNDSSALKKAEKIENFYGSTCTGQELYEEGIRQARALGAEVITDEVTEVLADENRFTVHTAGGLELASRTLLIATGKKRNTLNVPGLKELEGRGVSYCAVCDAFFYRDKPVVVIGSGPYAKKEAEALFRCSSVTILLNGERPEADFGDFTVIDKKITAVLGEQGKVAGVEFADGSRIECSGVFIALGTAGALDFALKLGLPTEDGNIITDGGETPIPGLFASGDCTGGILQVAKAVNEGMEVGTKIIKLLKNSGSGN